ncbi:transcriptional regulator, IclR family [Burkholderia vietnamiensis]|nr:DNA-binding transcriptional regulator [Burkholderia vietnamiensis]AFJ89356.1 Mhp operon transcriptional activator [Burkholderia sp. KJ006]TCT27423.1 IclR family transcriptional regulator [Burkholderia vietnamiensis]SCZ45171.1 transcriptional regulator, IclR family [Burkholderia vietnamiensis]SFY35875.1 transcriptional regulator, IclR family [Burkholderia vietnamiensis]
MHMIDLNGVFAVTTYTNVRGLARGLQVLRALNAMEDGHATSQQLADLTGLHRTTVRRLLETLMEEGFVRRSTSDDSFRLTLAVRSLSEGFTDTERIATVAPPIMGQLLQRVAWPSDLTTPDGDAMIIRETTHRFSRLSFHRAMVGRRLPMLLTAAGRAYFAMCPDEEREDILELLRSGAGGDEQQAFARNDALVRKLIRRVRDDGFGSNHGDWTAQAKIGAVAVAISADERVIASLNVIFLSRAVRLEDAVRRYVPELQKAALDIAEALKQESEARPRAST